MGLLGTSWEDPQSNAIMQLAGGLLSGNFGQGAAAYGATMAGAKDAAMRRQLMQSQMDENTSQAEARKQQMLMAQRAAAMEQSYFGAGGTPGSASPPAMTGAGGGASTATPPAEGKFDEWSRQYGIPKDALIVDYLKNSGKGIAEMLSKRGTPDMQVTNGYAYDKNRLGAGFMPFLSTSTSGQTSMGQIGPDGMPVVSAPRGALETAGAYAGMQAGLSAAGKVNLRDNPDGTKSPVSELTENPTLQGLIGIRPGAPAAPAGYATEPQMKATAGGNMGADPAALQREIKTTQRELMNPMDEPSKAMLRGYLADLQRQAADPRIAAQPGAAAVSTAGAPAYGMTNEQVIANKAKEETIVGTAKADVQATQGKQAGMDGAMNAYKLVDQALNHPGLRTATGLSGKVDPRNYIPGTDASNFDAVAKQLQGNAFLSAFASLKGAGQITEVEGQKATSAIARLQQSQSTEEYKSALKDYQDVIGQGLKRMGVDPAKMGGGASGGWGDKPQAANPLPANPSAQTLTKGQMYKLPNGVEAVWDGMKFKGK